MVIQTEIKNKEKESAGNSFFTALNNLVNQGSSQKAALSNTLQACFEFLQVSENEVNEVEYCT